MILDQIIMIFHASQCIQDPGDKIQIVFLRETEVTKTRSKMWVTVGK